MADERWKKCEGTWDRLKWARLQRFDTAVDAAPALNEEVGTYRAYERLPDSSKHIPLTHQKAMHFARKLGVRWEWLLAGQGEPYEAEHEEVAEIVRDLNALPEDRRKVVASAIRALLKTGTEG